ncbi:NAD(P)/FAD-dependent oxidoreductase [Hydrogenophaga defluvii]|uniref:NAD(P)/FAD-dependent oxidoreductase n=1 Tax=Hydrogenophaga defluvii TaxID=249410 RepID=A0ABW2SJJ4_9BURK
MLDFDVVIVGAGAAGLFCAGVAGQLGQRVLLIDHADKVAEKIRISGGGRANFTNRDLDPRAPQKHYLGENPHFCRSALSRYTPTDFTALLQRHGVPFHEKHKGQLFCDRSAEDLIKVLLRECETGGVTRWQPCAVKAVAHGADGYTLETGQGSVRAPALVVATGGLPIPKIGATDWGLRIARQFELPVVPTRPALVPLTFDEQAWAPFAELAGLALPVHIETGDKKTKGAFDEDLLFTHRGLSGPAVLQISSYWREGQPLRLDLLPGVNLLHTLTERKLSSRRLLANELSSLLPSRLADTWAAQDPLLQRPTNEVPDKALARLAEGLQRWQLTPTGTEGYRKAEVMAGGVDTKALSSQTMESQQPGLYFIGEVVDVTGWLGGYNFQWAWASAYACAQALAARG